MKPFFVIVFLFLCLCAYNAHAQYFEITTQDTTIKAIERDVYINVKKLSNYPIIAILLYKFKDNGNFVNHDDSILISNSDKILISELSIPFKENHKYSLHIFQYDDEGTRICDVRITK